jgi:hypothetical protein
MPSFTKSPPELVDRFLAVAAWHPAATQRQMFGYRALLIADALGTPLAGPCNA